jgi:hypothetical protein
MIKALYLFKRDTIIIRVRLARRLIEELVSGLFGDIPRLTSFGRLTGLRRYQFRLVFLG